MNNRLMWVIRAGVSVCFVPLATVVAVPASGPQGIDFEQRVSAQRAIEEVYWRHRIWPDANRQPKPPLSDVVSEETLRRRVGEYLKMSNALAQVWGRPVTSVMDKGFHRRNPSLGPSRDRRKPPPR